MALRRTSHLFMLSQKQFMLNATKGSSCTKAHQLPSSCNGPCWMSWQSSWPAAFQQVSSIRAVTTYPSLAASIKASIKVPSMGESIEEGTISAVLKQEGDSVEMDEAIFQIETDKVTVDVRSPEAGVLNKIMVKQDETVRVGQELADVGAGSGSDKPKSDDKSEAPTAKAPVEDDKSKLEKKPISEEPMGGQPSPKDTASSSSSQPEISQTPSTDSKSDPKPSKAEGATPQPGTDSGGPSIRFPRRRTPDGQRISALSAEEQEKYKEDNAPKAEQAPPAQSQPQAAARQGQKPAASDPNKFVPYAGQDRGTKLSQARVLSAREIEIIELGGADP